VRSESGNILGVIHEKFCVDNGEDVLITHMIYTGGSDLTARKQGLLDNGDGILVLPGGVGKFDELWDAVCGKSLDMKGMKHKPICVINSDGYFDGSIMQLKRAFEEGLLYHAVEDYFHVESTPSLALTWLMSKLEDRTISGTDDATSNVDKRMSIRSNA
jgi:predicted Rossmann-fold nucleotide-binding protein